MNIIFLDIDGVLNSTDYFKSEEYQSKKYNTYCDISDYHLEKLSQIYHTCNAQIVLSSTWRTLEEYDEAGQTHKMYEYLMNCLAKYNMKIMSKTPVIGYNRPLEIATWLENRSDRDRIRFVILDDDFGRDTYKVYGLDNYLVKTNMHNFYEELGINPEDDKDGKYGCGLQQYHVNEAIKILGDKL